MKELWSVCIVECGEGLGIKYLHLYMWTKKKKGLLAI